MDESTLEKLEQIAALRLLFRLGKGPSTISPLIRLAGRPDGISSERALRRARENLFHLGLMIEETEESPPFRTTLKLTEPKGKLASEKIRELLEILEGP